MSSNTHIDLSEIFFRNQQLFLYFGFWKLDPYSKFKFVYSFYTCFGFGLIILFLLPLILHMIANANDIMEVKCRKHFEIGKKAEAFGHSLFFFGILLGLFTQLFWCLKPLFENERTLPTKAWYPYNSSVTPYFEITTGCQTISIAYTIFHIINIDSFAKNLLIAIGAQCDILTYTLEHLNQFETVKGVLRMKEDSLKLSDQKFTRKMKDNLKQCIQHYVEVKRITKMVEDVYHIAFLALFIGGGFIFCTILYQLLRIKVGSTEFFYLLFYFFAMFTQQSGFCWIGTELTFKSSRIFNAIPKIPYWLDCDLEFRKMMVIAFLSVKEPLVIHAGRLIPLSIQVFLNVLRTSYSYFTLLSNI
ncbi:odorant receptor Or1-like [Sitophilus oryzae]|uniref:Odorant receptor n=1 Tax=Sitophilus oryzae TaxID=7048 RepID=A0A6J2XXA1_SITOR|nr:odorant receptor Or1-like [Sitophilus oryzae]